MEPVSATGVLLLLSPILPEIAKGITTGMGADLWKLIKSRFTSDKEKQLIEDFRHNPEDLKKLGQLEYVLNEKMERDQELTQKLSELVSAFNRQETNRIVQNNVYGDNIGRDKNIHH